MSTSAAAPAQAPADLVELGRVVSAYGVRGWIKIQPHSSKDGLLAAQTWWLKAPAPRGESGALPLAFPVQVKQSRPQGTTVVAEIDVVADRDQAEAMKGHTVWVPRADFPPADSDEYYWVDLIGCRLYGDLEGQSALIGVVQDVIDNGAHAVLRVQRKTESEQGELSPVLNDKDKPLEVLVPFVAAHVHGVDLEAKRLDSNWPVAF
ncbi:ribosome maturation factor RimM [Pollutimonas thiosulfatoxidans]|uniref:Ribosome maturation factor RimM n=1 Tax=Pollutimonas thiosulfatoxidans TaxID=2028345 RepID=A0A410GBA9_9BURK|nr:ribosome maturation factor RimM [Pollutimonas thiosulfatoxidans]MBF6617357.1 ribosome maturation factor RimM [Candidimonas sp.]QAA93580.1 ribosome maturation factor RimM [Pollutimonas thiosulfatoxidans]